MIREISIQNFKSVEKLTLGLGRVTVLIGENGSGKSNILEAIALLGAAAAEKLDNEFLVARGIRMAESPFMVSAFAKEGEFESKAESVELSAISENKRGLSLKLSPRTDRWSTLPRKFSVNIITETEQKQKTDSAKIMPVIDTPEKLLGLVKPTIETTPNGLSITLGPFEAANKVSEDVVRKFRDMILEQLNEGLSKLDQVTDEKELHCGRFLIYAPENSALRRFEEEGQIQPVGIRGEGLFKMLQAFANGEQTEQFSELKKSLELLGWFFDFSISPNAAPGDNRLRIHDRFLDPNVTFDQRSANEGFLFLLFYFAIFLSKTTPPFFAIDNIDVALNPKLCAELMRRICELAKKYDKQVILTTHNPAVLDGLNLSDDDQRLYSIYRNEEGRTKARRINAPKPRPGEMPIKISDAFLQGLIGGLPKNF